MNWVHPTTLVLASCLAVFLQAALPVWWEAPGFRLDLIPVLVVYGALRASLVSTTLVALVGGLGRDALSAGPFGLGAVPPLVLGVWLHSRRELVLRDSAWAQAVLGAGASLLCVALSLGLLGMVGPLLGRLEEGGQAWQVELAAPTWVLPPLGWSVLGGALWLTLGGLVATPLVFRVFGWVDAKFDYRPVSEGDVARRATREIRRGRY